MTVECIHGFEAGMCDICFPRVAPEPQRAAKPKRTTGASASGERRGATGTTGRAATGPANRGGTGSPRGAAESSLTLSAQRIYHVTHVRNLESILLDGALRAGAAPDVDVSSALTRELRAAVEIAPGSSLADYVPFHLSPDSLRWRELRTGAQGAHWSDEARRASPTDFVVLVADARAVGADVVVASKDAGAPDAEFAFGFDAGTALLRRVRQSDPGLQEPEVLVPGEFPVSSLAVIGVPNDKVRARVKDALAEVGGTAALVGAVPRVAVYPPWFEPPED